MNFFKFYLIFRKKYIHSLISANIKQITAVVPEIIDLEYEWDTSNLRIDAVKLYQETGQKYHVFLLKLTTPQNQNNAYAFNKPSLTFIKWHFAGTCFVHLHSAVKMKHKREQNLLIIIGKKGDPELSWLFHIKIQQIHQNAMSQVQNIRWSF